MAGEEATETFQTVKTRLRCQIDQNLIRKEVEDLEAVLIPEATLVNRAFQVSHLAGQCPRTQEATSSLWPRPLFEGEATETLQAVNSLVSQMAGQRPLTREDLKAILSRSFQPRLRPRPQETNLTKT